MSATAEFWLLLGAGLSLISAAFWFAMLGDDWRKKRREQRCAWSAPHRTDADA